VARFKTYTEILTGHNTRGIKTYTEISYCYDN